jgi:predicted  nucleic acid-binding Zn-ribbon protein
VLSALIQNFDTVEDVIETSANSAGSALKENERYLDSIQGKIDQFNNAMQSMWSNTLDSDWVKTIVDAGTKIINLIDDIGALTLALTGLFMLISTKYMNINWAHPIKSFKEMFGKPAAEDINLVKNNLKQLEAEYESAKQSFAADPSKANKKNLDDIEGRLQEYKNINNVTIDFQENLANAQSELAKAQNRLDNYTGQNANTIKKYQGDVKRAQANVDALTQSQQQAAQTGMNGWQRLGVKVDGFAQKVQSAIASMLVMYAISKIMSLIGDWWDKSHESAEEAKESFDELSSELSRTESELSTLESQLKDIKSQIEDISDNTPLSFTDQEE